MSRRRIILKCFALAEVLVSLSLAAMPRDKPEPLSVREPPKPLRWRCAKQIGPLLIATQYNWPIPYTMQYGPGVVHESLMFYAGAKWCSAYFGDNIAIYTNRDRPGKFVLQLVWGERSKCRVIDLN